VTTTSLFQSILRWLRAGYPEGVPGPDRVPLLALLRATPLTEDEVKEVVRNITDGNAGALTDGEISRWPESPPRRASPYRSDCVSMTNRYRTSLDNTRS
jgi:hypothetical protein